MRHSCTWIAFNQGNYYNMDLPYDKLKSITLIR